MLASVGVWAASQNPQLALGACEVLFGDWHCVLMGEKESSNLALMQHETGAAAAAGRREFTAPSRSIQRGDPG
jgi:hypothetical protein